VGNAFGLRSQLAGWQYSFSPRNGTSLDSSLPTCAISTPVPMGTRAGERKSGRALGSNGNATSIIVKPSPSSAQSGGQQPEPNVTRQGSTATTIMT
jgi:hypothetical protein